MAEDNKAKEPLKIATASDGGKATFSKEYLTNGDRFNFLDRSILSIELKNDESYTIDDAKNIVKKYKEAI